MLAPSPPVTATLPNVVLMGTTDCCIGAAGDVEGGVTINGGLSILSWLSPTPSDGLGHAGAVVGTSDR